MNLALYNSLLSWRRLYGGHRLRWTTQHMSLLRRVARLKLTVWRLR